MKHFNLLKTLLLLCALIVGSLSGWAGDVTITVSYNDIPDGFATNTGTSGTINRTVSTSNDLVIAYSGINTKSNASAADHAYGYAMFLKNNGFMYNSSTPVGYYPSKVTVTFGSNTGTSGKVGINFGTKALNTRNASVTGNVSKGGKCELTNSDQTKLYWNFSTTSSNVQVDNIVIIYSPITSLKVAAPQISGNTTFLTSTDVSITCGTVGALIKYSIDNGDSWMNYSEPFTVTETTTVKAKGVKDDYDDSDITSETFVKVTPMTVTEALAAIDALANNGTIKDQYVTGTVSTAGTSVGDGKMTYSISSDGTKTNELMVYLGKGLNNTAFSSENDLEIGDQVVIYGTLKKYVKNNTTTPEFNDGNYIVSLVEKPASGLAKTSDIVLDYKNDNTTADITDYITSSSDGAYTFTVADETVIENADELISALKVGTTTVTVNQAPTLSYKSGSVVINVTVNDTRVPATTIPAINISTLKKGDADGTISVLEPVKADDGVTFSFVSDNEDVLLIDGTTYTVGEIGTAKVTVTATPSDSKLYTAVVKTFDVTVEAATKTDNEIVLDAASGSVVYGTPKSVDYAIVDGYDGEMAYTIDNGAIADVAIGASSITFTPKAVGTAVVTISAPATATFNAAEDVIYTLTVNAPTGGTVAAVSSTTIFTETFDECNGTGANDGKWSGSIASGTPIYDNSGWTLSGGGKANKCVKLNKGENIESPSISLGGASELQVSFKVAGWNAESGDVTLSCNDDKAKLSTTTVAFVATEWNTRNFTISGIENASIKIKFATPSGKRIFIDDVVVSVPGVDITTKLNAYGYATFCSEYPLDFSEATDYTAWQVKGTSDSEITFEKITGSVKGGTGIFLMGEANATVTLKSADSDNVLSSNMLTGTLAPTYVTTVNGDYTNFGLSGDKFVKINNGTVKANKAYLPILTSNVPGAGARFNLVFENETDGIKTINKAQMTNDGYFDLQGRKVAQPTKGLYIVNGKKVVKK
ncbi:chitobiase/beta-hexosaminidase C-terminal domain-containing protein [uncultured Prevotella sp.]|uniref:chitobiase/beta-hexosaminidase C-terminal domain-containing protein n=1 Tax=uncultured Prevotella sp. TaxID=159272 RepID=UPI0025901002|nr:chitobiase/beta-hexosaminidase C-terminal domain-containing protein [uncultured Prevotella sp.]